MLKLLGFLIFMSVLCFFSAWSERTGRSRYDWLFEKKSLKDIDLKATSRKVDQALHPALGRFYIMVKNILPNRDLEEINQKLIWAGKPLNLTAEEFYASKAGISVIAAVITAILAAAGGSIILLLFSVIALIGGFQLPDIWLNNKITLRQLLIKSNLRKFGNLLATALEAGQSIRPAIYTVASKYKGLLGQEFMRVYEESKEGGRPVKEALIAMAERNNVRELASMVRAINRSSEYGTATAKNLRNLVEDLMDEWRNAAEEAATTSAVKILIPLAFLILIPTMGIAIYPASLNFLRALAS